MPWVHPLSDTSWILKELLRFGVTAGIRSKRPRRSLPYADELLQRSSVNYGKIKGRRR